MKDLQIRIATAAGFVMLALMLAASGGWGVLALIYTGPHSDTARFALAAVFAVVSLAVMIALGFRRWRWRAVSIYLVLFIALLAWYFTSKPSNERDWQTDVAVLPYATIEDNWVTVHNIRNFDYRSETDYAPAWYDKRFDLNKLESVDLIAVYWMGPDIAHVFQSFAFAGGEHLAISIEARKEKVEAYSTIKGFFRQYELYYVVADERDVIRLRTNYRHDPPEEVYVYRMSGPIENSRRLFLEYMIKMNELRSSPVFYNSLMTNCTTNIWLNSRVNPEHLPFSWKILATGHFPSFLYEHGRLASGGLSFPALQQQVHVNARAHAADMAVDFSRRIRAAQDTAVFIPLP
jgi:uncharacterized membrane protein YhaH (DUF805 family)